MSRNVMGMKRFGIASALIVGLAFGLTACNKDQEADGGHKQVGDHADVVVIGSELEGVYLAKAAQAEGLEVVILDPRNKPGGQLVQGEMIFLDEPQDGQGDSLLQGQVKKLFQEYKSGQLRKIEDFQGYYDELIQDIPIESGVALQEVIIGDAEGKRKVEQITYLTKDGVSRTITADHFVENTDFAALSSQLGLSRIPGIESVFGGGDRQHMASTMMMRFRGVDWKAFREGVHRLSQEEIDEKYGTTTTVTDTFTWGFGKVGARYTPTDPRLFLRGLNIVNLKDGEAAINALLIYDVDPADPVSLNDAIQKGHRETDLIVQHLRKELPGWEKAEVDGYPEHLYVRDYDRYETEYVLQASDIMRGTMFGDNVSIAGYPIDLQGILIHKWGTRKGEPDKYGIPLRSFIAKGYSNVIFAGKNVGATGAAYGSARIQPNTSLAGEVIGYLLGMTEGKLGLNELTEDRMVKLQDQIAEKYGITLRSEPGENRIPHLTPEEIQELDYGNYVVK